MRIAMKYGFYIFTILLFSVGCDTEGLISNPSFEVWCDNTPCGWQSRGKVERVSTWHLKDWAVSLKSNNAEVSQLNLVANASETDCFIFTLVAKISAGTRVFLELDFLDDGEIDVSQQLPESNWDKLTFRITPPTWFEGVRFIIRKNGSGEAIVGRIQAQPAHGLQTGILLPLEYGICKGEAVELPNRPLGANCERNDQCEQQLCVYGYCGHPCKIDADCSAGEVCGLEGWESSGHSGLLLWDLDWSRYCGKPARHGFGVACISDAECTTGICCNNLCSTCCNSPSCDAGVESDASDVDAGCMAIGCDSARKCEQALWPIDDVPSKGFDSYRPWICSPGASKGKSGDTCTTSSDCESNVCRDVGLRCNNLILCSDPAVCVEQCSTLQFVGGNCE
jgi:hypothetical protein